MSLVCINIEGLVDSILFSLGIFKFFSSYGTYYRIGENQRAKIHQDERERLNKYIQYTLGTRRETAAKTKVVFVLSITNN